MPGPEAIAVSLAAVAAVASAVAAFLSYRRERQWSHADTFLRIVDRLDCEESRRRRSHVNYRLSRAHRDWTTAEREEVRTLCADLDLVGVLLYSERDLRPFLEMYGDTVLRSIWVVAPYVNHAREERGDKFLLCLSRLTDGLVCQWRALAERGEFPEKMRFPDRGDVDELTPDTFESDAELRRFVAVAGRFQPPREPHGFRRRMPRRAERERRPGRRRRGHAHQRH